MELPNRQLGGSPFADSWLRDYYANTAGGQGLMKLFEILTGGSAAPGIGTMDWANDAAPPVQMPVGAKTDLPQLPPAPEPPAAPPATTVPGAQTLPKPEPRPVNPLLGMLIGPSAPPSQEGTTYAPSQGPGAAVTQPDPVAKNPLVSILEALASPPGANAAPQRAPTAPAPPGPSRMAPGQLLRTIGGQNPMAVSRGVNLPLLSRLLGGR